MIKLNSLMLPWPTDWTVLFGSDRPLIVEIGFGQGEVLLDLARRFPDCSVIGLEIANQSLTKAEQRIDRYQLHNLRVIHAMAETALAHLFTPASITQLHVNFPDPWFKSKHHHRRLMQRDTLDLMVNRLMPGGQFYLATDIRDYADLAADLLRHTPGLDNRLDQAWTNDPPDRVTTKYEQKARREGRTCYYFAYQRNHAPAPAAPEVKERPMPHVVFSSPLTLAEIAERFRADSNTANRP